LSAVLLSALIGLSAGLQFQHRLVYRQEWLAQRNFMWQLAWRAPGLEPGTLLMTSELPFLYYTDNSLTAPLNWTYAPANRSTQMPYLLYDVEARLGVDLPAIAPDQPVEMQYRATRFDGSTSQAIVVFYDPPRCVKVVDPAVDRFLPVKPLYIREMTPLSRLDLIQPQAEPPAAPPENLFGPEPPHAWCYYFQKAELFGQMGQWQQAAEAADQALKITKHFTDKNVSELFPFVEAYAHTGRWQKAVDLSLQAYRIWDKTQYPLCDVWARIQAQTPVGQAQMDAIQNVKESLECKMP
jgi:tetratricopeptide (TPR) repeat protein